MPEERGKRWKEWNGKEVFVSTWGLFLGFHCNGQDYLKKLIVLYVTVCYSHDWFFFSTSTPTPQLVMPLPWTVDKYLWYSRMIPQLKVSAWSGCVKGGTGLSFSGEKTKAGGYSSISWSSPCAVKDHEAVLACRGSIFCWHRRLCHSTPRSVNVDAAPQRPSKLHEFGVFLVCLSLKGGKVNKVLYHLQGCSCHYYLVNILTKALAKILILIITGVFPHFLLLGFDKQ